MAETNRPAFHSAHLSFPLNVTFPSRPNPRSMVSETLLDAIALYSIQFATEATKWVEQHVPYYSKLPAKERSSIQLLVQKSITLFVDWVRDPTKETNLYSNFSDDARLLTKSMTLSQSVEIIRTSLDFFERGAPLLAATKKEQQALSELILRYGREVGFASAANYAAAAESRGSWDARMEASLVDSIIRGESTTTLHSRASALNFHHIDYVTAIVCHKRDQSPPSSFSPHSTTNTLETTSDDATARPLIEAIHEIAHQHSHAALAVTHGEYIVILLTGKILSTRVITDLINLVPNRPVIIGPSVTSLEHAHHSCQEALSAIAAHHAWPAAPTPVFAEDLLPERALLGDHYALNHIIDKIQLTVLENNGSLAGTLDSYLETGSVEITARDLYIHPNTVRYRLRKVAELTGYEPFETRGSYALRIGLALTRLNPNYRVQTDRTHTGQNPNDAHTDQLVANLLYHTSLHQS